MVLFLNLTSTLPEDPMASKEQIQQLGDELWSVCLQRQRQSHSFSHSLSSTAPLCAHTLVLTPSWLGATCRYSGVTTLPHAIQIQLDLLL